MKKDGGGISYLKELVQKYPNDIDLGRALRSMSHNLSVEVDTKGKVLAQNGEVIGIDFDGTCVTHDFPHVGKDIGAIPVLKRMVERGNNLVLWTMRSGKFLNDAIEWFDKNDIPLWGIQTNPLQHTWTSSPKAYCGIYIDDAALGCFLKNDPTLSNRPFVDWQQVEISLESRGII